MNLDELQSVQSRERQIDSLQQLHDTFYEDAGRFIRQLREEREHVASNADDPFDSADVQRLTDEINTAEQTVEAIYERRIGKLVKQASLEAAGMAADVEGLTQEERTAFDRLVSTIEENRTRVLDGVLASAPDERESGVEIDESSSEPPDGERSEDGDPPTPERDPSFSASTDDPSGAKAEVASGDESDTDDGSDTTGSTHRVPPETTKEDAGEVPVHGSSDEQSAGSLLDSSGDENDSSSDHQDVSRVTIRITRDVGEILCVDDRAYELSTDDVVTLPETNAEPLIDHDAAIRLDEA